MLPTTGAHVVDEWLVEIAEEAEREWCVVVVVVVVIAAVKMRGGMGLADASGGSIIRRQ